MKRVDKDNYYLDIALAVAKRSTCLKRMYGAVIVKNDRIVATGYNGSPRGEVNCCDTDVCMRWNAEKGRGYDLCPAVHAEQNAMLSASMGELDGSTLYLACIASDTGIEEAFPKPCVECNRMIKNSGIKTICNRDGKWNVAPRVTKGGL